MKRPVLPPRLTIVFFHDGHVVVAQCMEHDLAAAGATLADAILALSDTIAGQIAIDLAAGREPLSETPPYRSSFLS